MPMRCEVPTAPGSSPFRETVAPARRTPECLSRRGTGTGEVGERRFRQPGRARNAISPDTRQGDLVPPLRWLSTVAGLTAATTHAAPAGPMGCCSDSEAPRAVRPGHRPTTGPRTGHCPQVRGRLQPAGQPQAGVLTIDQRARGTDGIAGHLTLTFSLDSNSATVHFYSALVSLVYDSVSN